MRIRDRASCGSRGRRSRSLKQDEPGKLVGVSRSAAGPGQKGETEPSSSKPFAIARATNQPLGWFAEGLDSEFARLEGFEPPTF